VSFYEKNEIAEFVLRDISAFYPDFFIKFRNPTKRILDVYQKLSEEEISLV
jgi:hypothetical protein